MTPAEHDLAAAKARIIAQGAIIDYLTDFVRLQIGLRPEPFRSAGQEEVRTKLAAAREEYSKMTLPMDSAARSDLHSALFQEAFEEISLKVANRVADGITLAESEKIGAILNTSR